MPYGFRIIKKDGANQVVCTRIMYRCRDCQFVSFNQDDEKIHKEKLQHYTISEMDHDSPEPYDEKIHGSLPWQTKRQMEMW